MASSSTLKRYENVTYDIYFIHLSDLPQIQLHTTTDWPHSVRVIVNSDRPNFVSLCLVQGHRPSAGVILFTSRMSELFALNIGTKAS